MSIAAQVSRVEVRPRGSSLVADVAAGATQVTVADPTLFGAADRVQVGDDVRDYTSKTLSDAPADVDGNPQQYATLTLTSGLSSALIMGTPVVLWSGDATTGQRLSDVVLWVDQFTPEAQPVPVIVPSAQRDRWTRYEGIVDPPIPGALSDDQQTFAADPGYQPLIDGTLIDPTTLPDTGSPSLIYIGVAPSLDVAPDFVAGSLPSGWTHDELNFDASGPVGAGVPGVSVVPASQAPTGASGGVLLVDTGANRTQSGSSSTQQPNGYFSGSGQVVSNAVSASAVEMRMRYRQSQDAQADIALVCQFRGPHYKADDNGYVSLRLNRASSTVYPDHDAGSVWVDTESTEATTLTPTIKTSGAYTSVTSWTNVAFRVEQGQASSKVWFDDESEPAWQVRSLPFVGELGDVGIAWERYDFDDYLVANPAANNGAKFWIDQFSATVLPKGMQVNPDASGDWPEALDPIRTKTAAAYDVATAFGDKVAANGTAITALGNRTTAVEGRFTGLATATAWQDAALTNSWAAQDAGNTPQYRLNGFGRVELRGLLKSGTPGQTAFTLPNGCRPSRTIRLSCYVHPSLTGVVTIGADGTVQPSGQSNFSYYSLDGISFPLA